MNAKALPVNDCENLENEREGVKKNNNTED